MQLDDLDRQIIELLQQDGRLTSQDLARQLDVTAVTIRNRVKRLEDDNMMRVVAVTDFSAAGFEALIAVGVEVQNRSAEEVARELARFEQVFSVSLVSGTQDIEMLVVAEDFEALQKFMGEELSRVAGISNLSPALALDVMKFQFNAAPLS
ncbi:Lrp/AsnC family transcriptional regulator [Emcibacter nanhaiensis]|uniref:Lrp/AsnC family transcriptional regulator n=1 Tax=Emcibacter nanhaiensis TaxID=1505037 RepID=A0A501PLQ8_9PROT|nr:Lrp/AsnC family transcriptional regulator [Emcibacter nanhaiensis]TPD60706.1 Lrp/AsnC family transcriptional regulator [Emcibacter nanhaiensis]